MVLAKNWPFFQLFILENIYPKNVFSDVLERKNGCIKDKNKQFKKKKNEDFSKEVYFREYRPKQCVLGYFRTEKRLPNL